MREREAAGSEGSGAPGKRAVTLEDLRQRALAAHADADSPAHNNYNLTFTPERASSYGVDRKGSSHPLTAEMEIHFLRSALPLRDFIQTLDIGSGTFTLEEPRLSVSAFFTADDLLVVTAEERGARLIESIRIRVPERRLLARRTQYAAVRGPDSATLSFDSSFYPRGEDESRFPPFAYHWLTRSRPWCSTATRRRPAGAS
jgi:hypothetical protein